MIAFYTTGAGLGHLTRTLKVIKTRQLTAPIVIFSNSQFIELDPPLLSLQNYCQAHRIELVSIKPDPNNISFLKEFIKQLTEKRVNELYIDCFPVGIYGELNGLTQNLVDIEVNLIARLIRWPNYQHLITKDNRFSSTLYVENLNKMQLEYCQQVSVNVTSLGLVPFLENKHTSDTSIATIEQPYCLFVHSGTEQEVAQLLDYGIQKLRFNQLDYQLVLASPWPIPEQFKHLNILVIKSYPLHSWLNEATVIVSAAGFNLMNEVAHLMAKHWALPFERRYDDQFERLAIKTNKNL